MLVLTNAHMLKKINLLEQNFKGSVAWPTVTGKELTSGQKEKPQGKKKTSWQKEKPHGKKKKLMAKTKRLSAKRITSWQKNKE